MPAAVFAALAAQAAAAVDAVMAEAWTLAPRKPGASVNAPDVPDPDRAGPTFVATFVDPEAKPEIPNSYDRRQARRPGEATGHPRLLVSPAARATLAAPIRQGDQLLRAADGVLWRVASAFPMAGGTLSLAITILG